MKIMRTRLANSREDGFTLIELLIVIVIIGILGGIAIFAVSQFTGDAKAACTKANARIDAGVSAANTIPGGGTYSSTGTCTP